MRTALALQDGAQMQKQTERFEQRMMGSSGVQGRLTLKALSSDIIFIAGCIGVFALHSSTAVAVLLFLGVWALRSPSNAVRALMLLVVLLYLNPIFGGFGREVAIGRWATFFAATGRILYGLGISSKSLYAITPVRYIHAFCAVAVLTSAIANPASLVSYLKIFSFILGTTALFAGVAMNALNKDKIVTWVISALLIVAIGSAIMFPLGMGRWENPDPLAPSQFDGKFMGMFSHPQSFGTYLALSTIFLFVTLTYSTYTLKEVLLLLIVINLGLLYLTASRGAMGTCVLGCTSAFLFATLSKMRGRPLHFGAKTYQLVLLAVLPFVVAVGYGLNAEGGLKGAATRFWSKGRDGIGFTEAYSDSRGLLMELSMNNFRNSPIWGIGFGVPSLAELDQRIAGDSVLGLVFAPTEKGNLATAVLEETGIAGTSVLVIGLLSLIALAFKTNNVYFFAQLVGFLLINMTEMIFFSMGGIGLYGWSLIALALMLGDRTNREIARVSARPQENRSSALA